MRVVLINPPQIFSKSQVTAGVVPPLGLLYLSGYLKKNGIDAIVIDSLGEKYQQYFSYNHKTLRGMTYEEIVEQIPPDADVIGLSLLYSSAYLSVRDLISLIRKKYAKAKIFLGGAHSSCLPEYTLRHTEADAIVIGEGERPFLNACRSLNELQKVRGLVYKKDGRIFYNAPEEFISNLDEIPFPDWDAIHLENYFKAAEPHGCSFSQKWVPILAGRGCPYECTFCTTPLIWRRKWRVRSVNNVIAEMTSLYEKYGVNDFHFEDENLGTNKNWLHQFCDALIEKNLPVTWQPSNGMRAETLLDPGLMAKMKKSGCTLVVFTLESASHRVRNEIIKKHLNIESVEKAVLLAKETGMRSTCYFMIGLPDERLEEAQQTIGYACHLAKKGLDECVISLFSMLPGCELFNNVFRTGKIILDDKYFQDLLSIGDLTRFKSWTRHISSQELKRLRLYGYMKFMVVKTIFHFQKTVRSLWNLVLGRDQLKSERVVRTFLKRFVSSPKIS